MAKQIFDSLEDRKKINLVDDPVRILRNEREKEKNLITRKRDRHSQEILARYNMDLQSYQEIMHAQEDNREQRLMLYSEIKALGWVLGKTEKAIVDDINGVEPRK